MTLGINGEDTLISISDKDFNEVLVDKFILKYTGENGIVLDMFERTAKEISDAKFEVLKKLLGKDVPIELQTDSYFNYILKVFGFRKGEVRWQKNNWKYFIIYSILKIVGAKMK